MYYKRDNFGKTDINMLKS